ncbi:MAG: hypothetical protein H2066_06735 [Candidatus Poseidoniales archaeon]|nr:hypothetical protein [Candidatus Poseidoniales archaeon]
MHTAAKVMFAIGGLLCVVGAVMWIGGAEAAEIDFENDAYYKGTGGSWDFDGEDWYLVYVDEGTSCNGFSATMTDQNGSTGDGWFEENIEIYECEDWDSQDTDGYIHVGYIGADDAGTYNMDSSSKIYVIGAGEELGEAIGGGLAILGSWGILCCGGFFILLGGIFALTLKTQQPVVVVQQQGAPMMGTPAMTQMAAPQMQQPAQYQQPVQEYQQPPQGGM